MGETFTALELQRVFETIWGHPLGANEFHRMLTVGGYVEEVGEGVGLLYRAVDDWPFGSPVRRRRPD